MSDILFVRKDGDEGLSVEEVKAIFESAENIDAIKDAVERAKDRLYVTWATVDARDNASEKVKIEDAIKEQEILMERGAPISDSHTNKIVGKTLAWKVLVHPKTNTPGILHLERIYNHNAFDDKVWKEIQSGERKGSSVGGYNENNKMVIDRNTGLPTKLLEGFHHVETASVMNPCNPLALNEAHSMVAKSNDQPEKDLSSSSQNQNHSEGASTPSSEVNKMEGVKKEDFETLKGDVAKLGEGLTSVVNAVNSLAKKLDEEKEKKKMDGGEEEEKKKPQVEKENAASDIAGLGSAKAPEAPHSADNNEGQVFKQMIAAEIAKGLDEIKKAIVPTPRVGSVTPVNKTSFDANAPLQMALGKKNIPFHEVNKMGEEVFRLNASGGY